MNTVTTQQYIDMLTLSSRPLMENIHKILSLFLVPAKVKNTIFGKRITPVKYGSYDIEEVADIILNNFAISDAYALMVFFCKVFESLMSRTQAYLIKEITRMSKKEKVMNQHLVKEMLNILNNGDGSKTLIKLHKELAELGIKFGS
jgi:hypothetical protein